MNEFDIIEKYVKGPISSSVVLGAGDDCSVVDYSETHYLLTTSDCLVEKKHFIKEEISFQDLGYKSLAVNLSDISAMGGVAQWAQLTLAIPPSVEESQVSSFFNGFYELAEREGVSLVGGDISSSETDIFINITLMGLVEKTKIKKRSQFKEGELLCVTGNLGDSAAGLRCLQEKKEGALEDVLKERHFRPMSFHNQGQWLSQQKSVEGMMDLSDGLVSDLQRLDCGFEVEFSKVPLSQEFKEICHKYSWSPKELALSGGEDYALMFSCKESSFDSLQKSYFKKFQESIFCIGKYLPKNKKSVFKDNGTLITESLEAFKHF